MNSRQPRDIGEYVQDAARAGRLVVQPRMGMPTPADMSSGLRAVATAGPRTVATITLDSYTRVGDHAGAGRALSAGEQLNGFPLVVHGAEVSARVAAAGHPVPVQVRHGSADPGAIFATMAAAGLSASEGGPVSYCLPYGRTPLAESVAAWRDAGAQLAHDCEAKGVRAHLETFGGCLLGQLCPPALLVAVSLLEALFFVQQGLRSVSLSYAQQTNPVQDIEALAALRALADELLPAQVDRHLVLYTYMGVFPRTPQGARLLLDTSAEIAVRGGAERLIVKTAAEAHRLPTVQENLEALRSADACAQRARRHSRLPWSHQADAGEILAEARSLIGVVLEHEDIGAGLLAAFREGRLDVPYCIHADNRGLTRGAVDAEGRLHWTSTGRLPLSAPPRPRSRLRSGELLEMLNYAAERHDRLALSRIPAPAVAAAPRPHRVAVIGTGPRGLAVLERAAARLAEQEAGPPVELFAIDAVEPGSGRIWRTEQPQVLLMNTPAGEVTMFSGPPDGGPARPGAGPSLAQWWREHEAQEGAPEYAPRAMYGRYLQFVFDAIERALPGRARLHRVRGQVIRMRRPDSGTGWMLTLADGRTVEADRVVLATGHPLPALSAGQQLLADFAATHQGLHYVQGDSAADMPLDRIEPSSTVGILGLGLAFYDVMSLLTEGRGGGYTTASDGSSLRYLPSGREPHLVAGSHSGVPLPARGRNQKQADHSYRARLFTRERIQRLRAHGRLDFDRQVLPWLRAEINLVHCATALGRHAGERIAEQYTRRAVSAANHSCAPDLAVVREARRWGLGESAPVDLERLARPFGSREFPDRTAYHQAVRDLIRDDLREAEKGNADGPLKAALDTLRDVRSTIRAAVDWSGLSARSHQEDFLGSFVPLCSHLSAGPPMARLRQVLALMDAGILELVGPQAQFATDSARGCFTVSSPRVAGPALRLDAVIDARIPIPDVRTDTSPLIRDLHSQGIVTSYSNTDENALFDTGGMAVTTAPFHPLDSTGRPVRDLYALGIPTEHTRWFTQVGSGRPGQWGEFTADADAIAGAALTRARHPVPAATEAAP